jgi:hypothetical protein
LLIQHLVGPSTHRVSFTTSSLPICQHSRIISLKTSNNQLFNTFLINLNLHRLLIKYMVKCKASIFSNNNLVVHDILYTRWLIYDRLPIYHRSYTNSNTYSIFIICMFLIFMFLICLWLHHYIVWCFLDLYYCLYNYAVF